jgi:hydrogenase maturation protease
MSASSGPIVIIGVGNVLLRDDGVGVHVIRELERQAARGDVGLPRDARLLDGGTLGLGLLPVLAGARAALFVDAADVGAEPGAVTILRGGALEPPARAARPILPTGVGDLLATARLMEMLPAACSLVGVQPGEIAAGLDLTPDVRAALPAAIAATIGEARRIDAEVAERPWAGTVASAATGSAA